MTAIERQELRELYAFDGWSDGYFDVDQQGHAIVRPNLDRADCDIDLVTLTHHIEKQGLALPVLVRFRDILRHRVRALHRAFDRARAEHAYTAHYMSVYPIKVNQHRSVVTCLVEDENSVGLEVGSKPELMAALAISRPDGAIVCNGYKDRAFVRLALIGQQMGYAVHVVVEKLSELELVLQEATRMKIKPSIGVRVRLATTGGGQWQNTGGERSKFGLSAAGVLDVMARLDQHDAKDTLTMLHIHLGSQVPSIAGIRRGVREAMRFYLELNQRGFDLEILDVGGGLGIDYEGTHSTGFFSMNYTLDEYADCIVQEVAATCKEYGLAHPLLISESGRALTAHHAVLIANVIDTERLEERIGKQPSDEAPSVLRYLWGLWERLARTKETGDAPALYAAVRSAMASAHDEYAWGQLDLEQRAQAEQLYRAALRSIRELAKKDLQTHAALLNEIDPLIADLYFCNLSIFQSMPDIWALEQLFPIVPLQRLNERPTRRIVLHDLTCDSDGRIDYYVGESGKQTSLNAHALESGESYLLGFFLVGAYQEILGDMHNLFGDTASVNVELDADGQYKLDAIEPGDRAEKLLRYVHFDPEELMTAYAQRLTELDLNEAQSSEYLRHLQDGLKAYTYMEK